MYPVQRSSQRLGLRELTVDDVDGVFAIYGNQEATEHLLFEPRTREQVGHIVARSIGAATEEPRGEYALAVVARDANELIGFGRIATDRTSNAQPPWASRCARMPWRTRCSRRSLMCTPGGNAGGVQRVPGARLRGQGLRAIPLDI
ncbi:GNAT family N-acetyltransferase [Streptomyces sp. NBC_00289]|uniref:GNAT family N-acetyltransferase n=1 Tax=Streptomyces sp. NBC_00289 TaxID=2975703 RepID=UPI00324E6015